MIVPHIACKGDVGPQDPWHLPVAGGAPLSRAHWMSVMRTGWALVGHATIVASPRFSTDRAAPGSASLHGLYPRQGKGNKKRAKERPVFHKNLPVWKKYTFLSSVLLMRESGCNGVTGS